MRMDENFCSIVIMATKSQAEILQNVTALESMLPEAYQPFLFRIREILMKDTVHLEEICANCNGEIAMQISPETREIINGDPAYSNVDAGENWRN